MLSSWLGTDRFGANCNGGMLRLIASRHDDDDDYQVLITTDLPIPEGLKAELA